MTSLISGQVDVMFVPIQSALPHIRSAKLRALGVSSPLRYATLPDTPPVAEALNAPGFEVDLWYGLVVPSQSPREAADHGSSGGLAAPGVGATAKNSPAWSGTRASVTSAGSAGPRG